MNMYSIGDVYTDAIKIPVEGRRFDQSFINQHDIYNDPSQLVAIHLTDTFPDSGVIKPTFTYIPNFFRDTVHFSLNGPVNAHDCGDWTKNRYAILVPFDRLLESNRVLSLGGDDTYLLGDVQLPEGSQIIAGSIVDIPKDAIGSKIGNAEIYLDNFNLPTQWKEYDRQGEVIKGLPPLQAAVYKNVVRQGYWPYQPLASNDGDNMGTVRQKIGIDRIPHIFHWTHALELSTDALMHFWLTGDPNLVIQTVDKIAPNEYKEYLVRRFNEVSRKFSPIDAEKSIIDFWLSAYFLARGSHKLEAPINDPRRIRKYLEDATKPFEIEGEELGSRRDIRQVHPEAVDFLTERMTVALSHGNLELHERTISYNDIEMYAASKSEIVQLSHKLTERLYKAEQPLAMVA